MKLILDGEEIHAAVKAYLGTDYIIKDLKVVVGRTKSSTRIEVDAGRVQGETIAPREVVKRPLETVIKEVEPDREIYSSSCFSKIEEE